MSNRKFKQGDFVIRRGKCDRKDHFKCHPLSFGQVVEYRMETFETRPDVELLGGNKEWEEIVILPFDKDMAPLSDNPIDQGWIQWSPVEMIRIPKFIYCLLGLLWPLLKLVSLKPLNGRITDY